MPCLDVRKEELYYSFYNLASPNQGKTKDDDITVIAEVVIGGKPYIVNRLNGIYLVQKASFIREIEELLEGDNFGLSNGKGKEYSQVRVILGGNCVLNYRELISELIQSNRIILLDKKNIYPQGKFLDMCVNFMVKSGIEPKEINPVYAREFIPFGKQENLKENEKK